MPGILQRGRDAIKHRLDRRYVRREDADEARRDIDGAREALARLSERVETLEARVDSELARLTSGLEATGRSLEDHRARSDEARARLAEILDRLTDETRRASAFVGDQDPNDLRKRLFEAHRLAREGAHAIELILQEELLLKRDLAARSEP